MSNLLSKNISIAIRAALLAFSVIMFTAGPVTAHELCASPQQAEQIQNFYADNLGAMPTIAVRKLNMPEAVVVSGLAAGQSVSTKADAFVEMKTRTPVCTAS